MEFDRQGPSAWQGRTISGREFAMKVLFLALVAGGLAAAPAFAETAKPADKATARTEPAKIRRAETIVDDSWTVTCAQTDEPEGKRHCSASLSIAQTDKSGGAARRVHLGNGPSGRQARLGDLRSLGDSDSARHGDQDRRQGGAQGRVFDLHAGSLRGAAAARGYGGQEPERRPDDRNHGARGQRRRCEVHRQYEGLRPGAGGPRQVGAFAGSVAPVGPGHSAGTAELARLPDRF